MGDYFQQLFDVHWWTSVLVLADSIFFILYCITIAYLFLFAVASVFKNRKHFPSPRKEGRFTVIFTIGTNSPLIIESVKSILLQDYSKEKYQVVVVSKADNMALNDQLRSMGVGVCVTDMEMYSKNRFLQYYMAGLDEKACDLVVIMDQDSVVEPTFLKEINRAYQAGCTAIQTHRISKDQESDIALFGVVSEEINNSIFRQGHINFGFSSALIGSGMAFKCSWLKRNIVKINTTSLETQLEQLLLEDCIFIEYLKDVHVYGGKVSKIEEFAQERKSWLSSGQRGLKNLIVKFPSAIASGNFDYCDKLFQWLLPSRIILIGTLLIITIILIFISWGMALKWVAILLILIVSFSIATPDHLIDARFIKALRGAPQLFMVIAFKSVANKILRR